MSSALHSGLIAAISGGYPEGKIVPGAFNMVRIAARYRRDLRRGAELLAEAKRTGVVQEGDQPGGAKDGSAGGGITASAIGTRRQILRCNRMSVTTCGHLWTAGQPSTA